MAFEIRLIIIWLNLKGFASTERPSTTSFTESVTPDIVAKGLQKACASCKEGPRGTGPNLNSSILPASHFRVSNMLLINVSNNRLLVMTMDMHSMTSVGASNVLSSSRRLVIPIIPCNGVLNSCERVCMLSFMALATRDSRSAAFSAFSLARRSVTSLSTTMDSSLSSSSRLVKSTEKNRFPTATSCDDCLPKNIFCKILQSARHGDNTSQKV
mmetsp:Transcript_9777/g.18881  ORF Transcript_9777/g.18881 Transcript_9777/m.18881 type:complete len:213 (+) Transcript_9777:214-852(+)